MKLSLVWLLPLLLIACVSDDSAGKAEPGASESATTGTLSKVEAPAPTLTSMPQPEEPASKAGAVVQPEAASAAPSQPAPAVRQAEAKPTGAPVPQAAQPPKPTQIPTPTPAGAAPGQAPVQPPVAALPPAKKQPSAVQMPTTPPLPLPVVLGPESKVDLMTLSGKNLGGPIKVFGKTIDENELRRWLCYYVGAKQVESSKYDVLCQQEIDKRKAAGEDVSKLEVTDAEFEKAQEKTRKDFLLKYPTLDFKTEVGRAFLGLDIYRLEDRRKMRFDKVFFPSDPANWPAVTTEAIVQASGGRSFVDDSFESYAARKQMMDAQGLDELPPEDPILVETLRSWLLESLNQFAQIEVSPAKLPADTLLTVEGVPVNVDKIWNLIEPYVNWENVADTRRFLTQLAVVEHDLELRNAMIPHEEFEKNFMPNVAFKDAIASYEMVALVLYGFPSMAADLRYERALRSYRKTIAEELAGNEKLQPFLQRANMIAAASRIDAEVILSTAYDFVNANWKVDGWKTAEAKAKGLKQKLDAGADWGDTLELHSDYWDPPMPEVGQKPQFGFNFKGRFGMQTRNQFVGDLHESEFVLFLQGKLCADDVYFDLKGGTISEPMKGRRGYYIARINSRSPGSSGLNLQVPQNREFLVNFVAMLRFGVHARQLFNDAIAKGDVTGF